MWHNLLDPSYGLRPIVWTAMGLSALQQLVGINVIFYYGEVLYKAAALRGHTSDKRPDRADQHCGHGTRHGPNPGWAESPFCWSGLWACPCRWPS